MKHWLTRAFSSILGLGILAASAAPLAADPVRAGDDTKAAPADLRKRGPVHCKDAEDIVLDKVLIEAKEVAVRISGACDVVIKNSVIKGGVHALLIEGSGDIELVNSTVDSAGSAVTIQGSGDVSLTGATVTGQKTAVLLQGSGNVSAKDTRFQGKKVVQGTGEYEDRGGNTWKK